MSHEVCESSVLQGQVLQLTVVDMLLPTNPHFMTPSRNWTVEDRSIVVAKTREENIDWLLPFCEE